MTLIACCDARWGLGKDGALLVRIPEDLRRFRTLTLGKTVIYGRKTLQTFPGGRPLENRRNVILSRDPGFIVPGADSCASVEAALDLCGPDAFVIGGGEIYRAFLPHCDTALITRLERELEADCFLPSLDDAPDWMLSEPGEPLLHGDLIYRFCEYHRFPIDP